jgi:phosphoribosylanthranilate isomerase
MRAKICGLCRPQDAAEAAAAGADYVGVILADGFARSQTIVAARAILDAAEGVKRVGVFVNSDLDAIRQAIQSLRLDVVQLHGDETRATAQAIAGSARVWKAVRVRAASDFVAVANEFAGSASGILLDAYDPARAGGTGKTLDWSDLRTARSTVPANLELVLAGGLTPDNVAEAINALRPDVVDVSSGVESSVGQKSAERIRRFIDNARNAPSAAANR